MAVKIGVIGGGISGLSTAFYIQEMAKEEGINIDLTVFEASERLGGKAFTFREEKFSLETGVNGFLTNKPDTLKLVDKLGINEHLYPSNDSARKRFIFSDGRLQKLPEGPQAFLKSSLISWPGKLRIAMEPFTKPKKEGKTESVAEFGERHLGKEAVDKLIGPMIAGIYAGDAANTELKSAFPLLIDIETMGKGSLIKGMMKRVKESKKQGKKMKASAGPTGALTSFDRGMSVLIDSLESKIIGRIIKGVHVDQVYKDGEGYVLISKNGQERFDIIVSAAPAYAASKIFENMNKDLAGKLSEIPYVAVNVVALIFKRSDLKREFDGFGFLIPKKEGRRILGSLWTSSIFPKRGPEDLFIFRSMMGGALRPELAALPEKEQLEIVKEELKDILGIDAQPIYSRIFSHKWAIPQYPVGHSERIARIYEIASGYNGLFLTGNAFRGIGINDCTKNAEIIAKEVIKYIKSN